MRAKQSNPQTKSATVIKLLNSKKGASIDEICRVSSWQSHSVRAFLTGLRKRGFIIVRELRDKDCTVYRTTQSPVKSDVADAA